MKKFSLISVFFVTAISIIEVYAQNTFPATGNVGIGTIFTYRKLHLFEGIQNANLGIRLTATGTSQGSSIPYNTWDIINDPNGNTSDLLFQYGYSSSATSNPSMSTVVKITSGSLIYAKRYNDLDNNTYYLDPSSTGISLKVRGKVEAAEIEVKLMSSNGINSEFINTDKLTVSIDNVADYVFEPDYNLRPLHEVEQFVKENKHLPGIPAGKHLKENGMDLAQMNNLLLEKIEEITLYTIELYKQVEMLKQQNRLFEEKPAVQTEGNN